MSQIYCEKHTGEALGVFDLADISKDFFSLTKIHKC